nr:4Fe-4S binding protein [Candidatus Sigynarchaeota archaeon]
MSGYIGNFKTSLNYGPESKNMEFDHGVIIVATGAKEYEPKEYLYGKNPNVIRQSDLEHQLNTSDAIKNKKSVVMIQCVGSRNKTHPYCSKMCCAEAIKNAIHIKNTNPSTEVLILFRDIRTYGFKEEYFRKAREMGIIFVPFETSNEPVIVEDGDGLLITVTSPRAGHFSVKSDLVVLSVGITASEDNEAIAQMLKVPLNDDHFFLEAHVKLRPVDFATEGVFVAGMAHCPKPIEDAITQANAAVARACTILSKKEIEAEGKTAKIDISRCMGCGMCVENCAYNAIELINDRRFGIVASVNEALCKGCGACSGNCR